MATIRKLLLEVAPARPDDLGDALYERFKNEPDTLIVPVIDEEHRPIGMLERHGFFLSMGAAFGRAVLAGRPIRMQMGAAPPVVEADTSTAQFMDRVLAERSSDLLQGFIVTDGGRYLGIVTALSLLQHAHAKAQARMAELSRSAEKLSFANAEARQAQAFMTTVIESMPAMVFVKRADDHSYVLFNKAGEDIMQTRREEIIGRRDADFFTPEEAAEQEERDRIALESGEPVLVEEKRIRRRDGSEALLRVRKIGVHDSAGRPQFIVGVGEDITARRHAEAKIEQLAHYDPLTGLPNRALFQTQFHQALDKARGGGGLAVLCIDLDHFKTVNDTLGHSLGDQVLEEAAKRLQKCVRAGDTAARLGGDEFAVLQGGFTSRQACTRLAKRVVDAMSEPYEINGHQVVIGASVGISVYGDDGIAAEDLLKKADMALYRVKKEGRGGVHFFEKGMDEQLQSRRRTEIDLRRAIQTGELELHYQPLLDLKSGRVSGCEALVRWNHPERGQVPPSDFIPLAEETGLIVPLGEWMLRRACEEAAQWPGDIRIAVNISAVQVRNADFVSTVVSALANAGLDPKRLEIEITESVLLQDTAGNIDVLHRLRALGVRISMDDFGTGYSSLSYLRSFPFDKIKIDQAFVRDLPRDTEALAIIRAVTGLSASLGIVTTAEGVETEAQLAQLREQGCCEVQGYLISRPAPSAEIQLFLRDAAAAPPSRPQPTVILEPLARAEAPATGRRRRAG
jgi:diguanylate cyclase (GGDEF)-like protein/PAS domain S-box-containing protein